MNLQTKGDLIAIPFFLLILYYVYNTHPKSKKEVYLKYISIIFLVCAFIADTYFILSFYNK
jgi:hypothetical protein